MCFVLIVGAAVGLSSNGCGSDDSSNGGFPGGEMDAATDGTSDTSNDPGPGCVPHDVVGWTPSAPKRSVGHPGACTDEFIARMVDDCFGSGATVASCNSWVGADADTAHKTCAACVLTDETNPTYGAIIGQPNYHVAYGNADGCIEVLTGVTDCADKFQAWLGCHEQACAAPWCVVSDAAGSQAWIACTESSDLGTCASYLEADTNCREQQLQGAGAVCLTSPTDFVANTKAVAKVFCGGG